MASLLFTLFLLGAVFTAFRRAARRQANLVDIDSAFEPLLEPEPLPYEPVPPPVRVAPVAKVAMTPAAISVPRAATSPAYLLSRRRSGDGRDRTAETMAMLSGPGLCTPRNP